MALKYNPLLKIGLQEIGKDYSTDISALQNAINSLQSQANALQTALNTLKGNKITKCFTAADLANLEINEIFEWQGENTIVEGVTVENGYFYKYVPTETITITPPNLYYQINNDIITNLITIKSGIFYENGYGSAHGLVSFNNNSRRFYSIYDLDILPSSMPKIGDIIFDAQNMVFSEIVSVQGDFDTVTDNLGNVFDYNYFNTASSTQTFNFISADGLYNFDISNTNDAWIFVQFGDKEAVIVIPHLTPYYTDTPIIITKGGLQQTDTQPRLQNIENASNGDVNIGSNLNVSGNLTVLGTQSIVHTQQIESEKDFIILRDGNPLALGNNEQSGIKVSNYDGNNQNCVLGVDSQGWARVGDESGTLQKIATIEDNPTDGQFLTYNANDKELETKDIADATIDFTGTFKLTQNIFSGNSLSAMFRIIHGGLFTCQYTSGSIYDKIVELINGAIRCGCVSAVETTGAFLPTANEGYNVLYFCTDLGSNVTLLAIGYEVNTIYISHFRHTQTYTSFTWVQL